MLTMRAMKGRSEMQGKVRYGTTLDFLDRVLHVFAYGDSWHFRGNELRDCSSRWVHATCAVKRLR